MLRWPSPPWLSLASALIVATAAFRMALDLREPVHGDFYFRQAHVAANIEKFLDEGLSWAPSTYNQDIPLSLFDFPAYQYLVVGICRLFGSDPLATARLASIFFFLGSAFYLLRITGFCGVGPGTRALTLFFFSFSPLTLFYFHVPIVDTAAIFLSLVSLHAFLEWQSAGSKAYLAAMIASGVLATLIKNPVYLAFFVAQAWYLMRSRGALALARPAFVFHALMISAAVLAFKWFSNSVNGIEGFLGANEGQQFFGPLEDRLDSRSWSRILGVLSTQALVPVSVALSLIGGVFEALRSRAPHASVMTGLLLGSLATALVFFNRHTWHAYYQLPFVLPLSFFAARGIDALIAFGRKLPRRISPAWSAALLALVIASALQAHESFLAREANPTEWIAENGELIQWNTDPDDFVIYLVDSDDGRDWNPAFLYFAQRDGYNLTRARFGRRPRVIEGIRARYAPDYARVLVFCPEKLRRKLGAALEARGAVLVAAGPPGVLYELPPRERGPAAASPSSE